MRQGVCFVAVALEFTPVEWQGRVNSGMARTYSRRCPNWPLRYVRLNAADENAIPLVCGGGPSSRAAAR